jgi:hypothetical protein
VSNCFENSAPFDAGALVVFTVADLLVVIVDILA